MDGRVLIVEDTRTFATLLQRELEQNYGLSTVGAASLEEMRQVVLRDGAGSFDVALLDLNLPDAQGGEIVDYAMQKGLPSIVFTGEFNDDLRGQMIAKRVIDYVHKGGAESVTYVGKLVHRILKNRSIRVLVVDDSRTARNYIAGLLRIQQYQVLEADNGEDALRLLKDHPGVGLVITDYHMPGMDGYELVRRIRQEHDRSRLAVIGVSAHGSNLISARFIKNGANDFITKPFLEEEFYCRVTQNIELMETIQALAEASVRDFLTGLHNRRFFYESAQKCFASAQRGQITIALAMVDIDHFKKLNDTHGHEAGDEVLRNVGEVLRSSFRETDIVARMGGEEFCVLLVNMAWESAKVFFERLRVILASHEIRYKGQNLRITASIGACTGLHESLPAMIHAADEMLYKAKAAGRNRVVVAE
jgi:diguanylate cyclase (GGDEF)-like protein